MTIPSGHSSILLVDYIIYKYGCRFTPFKLSKLIFLSHGLMLASTNKPLIRDRIDAWKYGPAIPLLHHELIRFGGGIVQTFVYTGMVPYESSVSTIMEKLFLSVMNNTECEIIDFVVKHYGDWSANDLQKLCQEPGSPWDTHYDGNIGTEIPDNTIQKYYKKEQQILNQ